MGFPINACFELLSPYRVEIGHKKGVTSALSLMEHVKQNDSEENLGGRLDCDSNSVFSIDFSESITDLADGAVCKHGPEGILN